MSYRENVKRSLYTDYLENLERSSAECRLEDYYLWPRTPLHDIQLKILQRVGATDYQTEIPHSRSALIIKQIRTLRDNNFIQPNFSMLDIACGDGIILWHIKKTFSEAQCFGIDCNKGRIATHTLVQQDGVNLYSVYIQHLFQTYINKPFDIVLMLNTYRGWESADLREHERNLPDLADSWFEKNARYTIVTATHSQIGKFKKLGFAVKKMGKGEDNSTMICLSKEELPRFYYRGCIKRLLK